MNPDLRKQSIRRHILETRNMIPAATVKELSNLITGHIISLPEFEQANIIHCYLSIDSRNEVETGPLIEIIKNSSKKLVVPKIVTDGDTDTLVHLELDSDTQLVNNSLGIPEPTSGKEIDSADIDLVIVPILGADRNRNRLGYGKGYYDRFLSKIDAVKTGIVFERYLFDDGLPVETFDVPMDIIITESEVIR